MIVNTVGPPGAKMFFVGEAPGEEEDKLGQPFKGDAGKVLDWLLSQSRISRAECLIGNVARERPPGNKISLFFEDSKLTIPKQKLINWIAQLKAEIELHQPNVIVALGAIALWALTGEKRISEFRGTILPSTLVPGVKVLPTFHPSAVRRQWNLYWTVLMDLKKAQHHSTFRNIPPDKRVLVQASSANDFILYCNALKQQGNYVSVDIETCQPGSHISILGIASSPSYAMSVRLIEGSHPTLRPKDEIDLWRAVAELLDNNQVIMQNAPYDTGVILMNQGIRVRKLWMDTLLAAHVCWPETPRDLGFLASICLDVPAWKHTSKWDAMMYNAADAANTYGIALFLAKELEKLGVEDTFNLEMREISPSLMMQLRGIPVNMERRDVLLQEHTAMRDRAEMQLNHILGKKINYKSSKQVQTLLYVDMGLPVQYKRRKKKTDPKKMTAGKEALKKLAAMIPNNPLFNLLLEYKEQQKLCTFLNCTVSPKGNVHTSYNITGSSVDDIGRKSFGRWSSSESIILPYGPGNLQNIPPEARKMFHARKGWVLLQADKVQAEAVVVAYLSNNHKEKKLFKDRLIAVGEEKKKFDIHKLTAANMFKITVDAVTKEHRTVGKTLRHAVSYSAGPGVVSTKLGCKMNVAKNLLETYFNSNPTLKIWHMSIQNKLREDRVLTTPLGRRHKFLGRWGEDLFRSAYSFLPQSTVGDLLNRDLCNIYDDYGSELDIWLQLHDAIYLHVPEKEIEDVQKLCMKYMLQPTPINYDEMVIEVDFKAGPSWGEQEEIPLP
jgi:uracil-DNA glycosylase